MSSAIIPYTQTLVTARMIKFASTIRRIALLSLFGKSISVNCFIYPASRFFHATQSSAVPSDSFCSHRSLFPQCLPLPPYQHPFRDILSESYLLNCTDTRCHPVCDRKCTEPDCKIHWLRQAFLSGYDPVQFIIQNPRVIDATIKTTSNGCRKIFLSPISSVSLCAKIHAATHTTAMQASIIYHASFGASSPNQYH